MSSNLPPGCSDADIPGCRPMDIAIDRAIEAKDCIACKWCEEPNFCEACIAKGGCLAFEPPYDLQIVADRLQAASKAREDEHEDE